MRLPATIHRRPAGARTRERFHTAALFVLFAALAWITDSQEHRPQPRAVDATADLQDGCRRQASVPAAPVGRTVAVMPCAFAPAHPPSK